jgi:hypothetical protein
VTASHPGSIAFAFAPIGGSDAIAAHEHLARLWRACEALGMPDPLIDGLSTVMPEPPTMDAPSFRMLAGRSGAAGDLVRQAFIFERHDVIGLVAAQASGRPDHGLDWWARFHGEWRRATGDPVPPPALLGEALLFTAHAGGAPRDIPAAFAGPVVDALRGTGLDAWEGGYVTQDGYSLWEWQDSAGRRIVAAVSALTVEDEFSRWAWWQGQRELAPFALYLLDAAKLAYELRVYGRRRQTVEAAIGSVDAGLRDVLALHGSVELTGRASMQRLVDAQGRLTAAQSDSAGLLIELTQLRALQRTAGIARRNLAALVPPPASGTSAAGDFMFARDVAEAAWLEDQLGHDIGYGEDVAARAREAQNLTMLRLQEAATQIARSQARLSLLQTSIIGALLTGLGAVATFRLTFDPPPALRLPLLVTLVSLLLAAPALATHWHERYRAVDYAAATLLGAAIGWLGASSVVSDAGSLFWLVGVVMGASVGALAARLHDAGGTIPARR